PHHHRRPAGSPPRRLHRLDPGRRPSRGATVPERARAGPVRFRPGLAPRPEGAHQAGLEGQRGLLHRGRAVERLTGGLTPSPPVVVRAAAGTHTIGFDFTCAETLTPERVSQSPLLTACGVPADPAVVASSKPGLCGPEKPGEKA